MLRKPDFSYKPSITANEPNIEQTRKKEFSKEDECIWYMDTTIRHQIKFGRIVKILNNYIIINFEGDVNNTTIDSNEVYPTLPNLKEGQEIVLFEYCIDTLHEPFDRNIHIFGISDKREYDNSVRDSQKLPKGWKHEPYYIISDKRGVKSYEINNGKTYPYMKPDNAPNTKYLICGNEFLDKSNALIGDRIVELAFTMVYPDDEMESTKIIYAESIYNSYEDIIKKK